MSTDGEFVPLSPDEAFAALGNATRMAVVRALADADGPVPFGELRRRVGMQDSGQFNYHLEKLVGHFVGRTEEGYTLRQTGRRVLEAVLSGAVTEEPVLEPAPVPEWPCPYCGGTVEVGYEQEQVGRHCTECEGLYGDISSGTARQSRKGNLGSLQLPPAGVAGRDHREVLATALTWSYADWLVIANGVCPRCSARVEHDLELCTDHEADGRVCGSCGRRQAIGFRSTCCTCGFSLGSILSMHVWASTEVLAFLTARGVNPLGEQGGWGWEYGEALLSTEPFRARLTFTLGGDSLTVTVDGTLSVVEAVTHESG